MQGATALFGNSIFLMIYMHVQFNDHLAKVRTSSMLCQHLRHTVQNCSEGFATQFVIVTITV